MEQLKTLSVYAGPIALAAFAGVFLGGIALSFFWKNFGPWKLLEACREECKAGQAEREAGQARELRLQAQLADVNARHETLLDAVERGGLGLRLIAIPPRGGL